MTLAIPTWPRRDPQHQGTFNFDFEEEIEIDAGGYTDVEIGSGVVNLIYRLECKDASSSWQIKLFDRAARAAADLAWASGLKTGDWNSVDDALGLIVCPDKDGTSLLHLRVLGTVGDTMTLTFHLVRFGGGHS